MQFREYGEGNKETLVFLHGGGLSWWNYREAAELLQDEYHVVLPILDGHAGSDREFTSIEDNAREVIAWIDAEAGGSVRLLGGLSLGAQVTLEMLSQRKGLCSVALIESAAVLPSKLTNALIGPTFAGSYGLIKNKTFAKAQFRSLHIKPNLFEDYYRDTCQIKKEDLIAFLRANTAYQLKGTLSQTDAAVHVFYGEKETGEIRRSAEAIRKALPEAKVQMLPGLRHGEFSMNHAADYAKTVRKLLK